MYKKIILSFLLIFCLVGCTAAQPSKEEAKKTIEQPYIKAVWLSYYELSSFTEDNDEAHFKKSISKAFKTLSSKGFNRVTVQVRPFADAFYKSDYFPVSSYCFGQQGSELLYDPLSIMVEAAHKYNMSIEAWINPYRVSSKKDFSDLSQDNIALTMKDSEDLIVCDTGIYFNPACDKVTELIVNGVKEIASNYAVDSICFDDYFYPSTDKSIDKEYYEAYKKSGGDLSLDDYRRDNVSKMVSSVYKAIKDINSTITFGISPASNVESNNNTLYADVQKWATEKGYVDYLCPQIYYGFQNENQPFMSTTKEWIQMTECTLYVALPMYKAGKEDEFAGERGKKEFEENNNIVGRQVTYLSKLDKVKGFYIFSYSSLKDNDETENLYSAMQ